MRAAIFQAMTDALAFSDAVDVALGYPVQGVDVGGGQHAPDASSDALHYSAVLAHPTRPLWAFVADAQTLPAMDAATAATVVELDATWAPPPSPPSTP